MTKLEKFFEEKGFNPKDLLTPHTNFHVKNMDDAVSLLKKSVGKARNVFVVADYDCDGVCSGLILDNILRKMGAKYQIRFPRRMSEGYGISEKILSEVPDNSLLITVDNGIAAAEVLTKAVEEKKCDVIVLDHHLQREDGSVPPGIVCDPHVFNDNSGFEHFCGAGLSLCFAEALGTRDNLDRTYAAIATVQDVVPLIDENRWIVRNGIELIKQNSGAVKALISELGCSQGMMTEEEIAFKIGPSINAMGRLYDDGAEKAFRYISTNDAEGIKTIVETNNLRKEKTAEQEAILENIANSIFVKGKTSVLVVAAENLHEGIIGINAAKLVEKYGVPSIVFTNNDGNFKGSARSVNGINIKEALDSVKDLTVGYGGHASAAGVTIPIENIDEFRRRINENTGIVDVNLDNGWDIEISEKSIASEYEQLRKYAPYGEGFPIPVFKIPRVELQRRFGKYYRQIGADGISLNGNGYDIVSFSLYKEYEELHRPMCLDLVGTIGWSNFSHKPQILLSHIIPNNYIRKLI